jgi:hypothetical protein
MLRVLGERLATFGIGLAVGVGVIFCTGAPAPAAEATLKDAPSSGTTAAIAVPNFLNYRNKSRVASAVGTGEGIRAVGIDGTDEEDIDLPVAQHTRPPGEPQGPGGIIDDSGSMNWERMRGLRTMPCQ